MCGVDFGNAIVSGVPKHFSTADYLRDVVRVAIITNGQKVQKIDKAWYTLIGYFCQRVPVLTIRFLLPST